jgi:hypothetical protein
VVAFFSVYRYLVAYPYRSPQPDTPRRRLEVPQVTAHQDVPTIGGNGSVTVGVVTPPARGAVPQGHGC